MSRPSTLRRRQVAYLSSLVAVCLLMGSADTVLCVFDAPALQARVANLLRAGQYSVAESSCRKLAEIVPYDATAHYNLACSLARQGKVDESLASLERSIELGFHDARLLETDEDLAGLREQSRFEKALAYAAAANRTQVFQRPSSVTPAPLVDGVGTVACDNTAWDASLGIFRAYFDLDAVPGDSEPVARNFGRAGELLNAWQAQGTAAGNHGDLYDNHDNDHSNMKYGMFPQLSRIEFSDLAKERRLHHGLQIQLLYNGATIGNSSTAIVSGPLWRSQARFALTTSRGPVMLFAQYRSNHMYFYPEHRDHDIGHNRQDGGGYGDVFACNTPYVVISQGSSGSDRVFLQAVAGTLAAFRPDVKSKLMQTGALMPAVQMILRRCNKPVTTDEDYLSGVAHPTVFEGDQLDAERMVTLAHEIDPDNVPPLVQLQVLQEDLAVPGRDYFAAQGGETLFDTPCAVARLARSTRYLRRMVVSAEPSVDLNERPLTYHWRVLRGDAERIEIKPLNQAGSVVELRIPYHTRRPIAAGSKLESNRVDIGAFVHNGQYYSAPAFVSIFYLDNQRRVYDDQQRIQSVDYADPQVGKNYVDPLLDARKQWRDDYHYDSSGALTGWTRTRGESSEQFTADGLLVDKTDAEGRVTEARRVRYVVQSDVQRVPILRQQVSGEIIALP